MLVMSNKRLSPQQVGAYHKDGYVLVKSFCNKEEADVLFNTAIEDNAMKNNALDLNDQSGKKTKLSLWFSPGNDVFGYLTRSVKMVHYIAQLLYIDVTDCNLL